jgi:hypothetical protein
MIYFSPRQGEEPSDEVRLRGEPAVVNKLKADLERVVSELRNRSVVGVNVPASVHRLLIGRGGRNLNEFQDKFKVQVQYPGSHGYWNLDTPENEDELADCPPENLVKISGARENILKAAEEMKKHAKPQVSEAVTDTITVPLKYHHAVSQQGNLLRTLRSYGVTVDQSVLPQKSAVPARPAPANDAPAVPAARIDDAEQEEAAAPTGGVQWEVIRNYEDAETGESEWTLKARDSAGLDRAKKTIEEAIAKAEDMTHVGFLTLPDRSSFPRIIGTKGANISRLHGETGADITVGRDTNTIVIMGTFSFFSFM